MQMRVIEGEKRTAADLFAGVRAAALRFCGAKRRTILCVCRMR